MKLKRILSVVTASFLFAQVSCPFVTSANHWAQKEMEYLFEKGVISGDDDGLRPDEFITRAEFAKVINKDFGFTEKAEMNFPDVSAEAWYAGEMAAAKQKGYFSGDQNGLGNPDERITRSEVCVAYTKILSLPLANENDISYTDRDQIPQWAVPYIAALAKINILNGYEDGSFRATDYITRAEVFSTVVRTESYAKKVQQEELENGTKVPGGTGGTIIGGSTGSSGGSGGSGGSSGGGGSTQSSLSRPVIIQIDTANRRVNWESVKNAASYEMILRRTTAGNGGQKELTGLTGTSADISSAINELIGEEQIALETFSVKMRAVRGSKTSAYSAEETFHLTFESVAIPDDIRCEERQEAGKDVIVLTWSAVENAKEYKVFLVNGHEDIPLTVNGTYAVIPEEYTALGEIKIKFKTLSGKEGLVDSLYLEKTLKLPLFYGGSGEVNDPYIIASERHFRNIRQAPDKNFKIIKDISLSQLGPIPAFSGTLVGEKDNIAENPVRITYNFEDGTKGNMGLITSSSGVIKNLILSGQMTAGTISGALVSTATGGEISNCVNEMTLHFVGEKWCGGLIGTAQSTVIQNCGNKGDILSSALNTGGIVGYLNSMASVFNCFNEGDINASADYTGGLVGAGYGNIEGGYNSGDITSTANTAAGISGYLRQSAGGTLKYAFNTGKIHAKQNAGGITCNINPSGDTTIDEVYNAGDVTADTPNSAAYVFLLKQAPTKIKIGSSVYYLNGIQGEVTFEGETKPLIVKELSELCFPSGLWVKKGDYPYPQLKELTYLGKGDMVPLVPEMPAAEIVQQNQNVIVMLSGHPQHFQYQVQVWYNGSMTKEYFVGGGINRQIDITDGLLEYGEYLVKVTAYGDGIHYSKSDVLSLSYQHKAPEKQLLKNLRVQWQDNGGQENYSLTWDSFAGAYNYKIQVKNQLQEVKLDVEAVQNAYVFAETTALTFDGDYTVTVTAMSQTNEPLTLETALSFSTLFAGGTGTLEDRYLIANQRHWNNVALESNKNYRVIRDITLDELKPIDSFSGSMIGALDGIENSPVRITYHYSNPKGVSVGLFKSISGADIQYIGVAGTLTAAAGSGALAASITNTEISHCFSEMEASYKGGTKCGGLVGAALQNSVIRSCYNAGNITDTTTGMLGGIAGFLDTNAKIYDCYNIGDISSSSNNIGGIVGALQGSIEGAYNTGNISSTLDTAGGIAGYASQGAGGTMKYLFNTGTITSAKMAGGIVSRIRTKNGTTMLDEVYNAGDVISGNGTAGYIVPTIENNVTTLGNYVFYLEGIQGGKEANGISVASGDLSNQAKMIFPEEKWTFREGYQYPQLKAVSYRNQ